MTLVYNVSVLENTGHLKATTIATSGLWGQM